MRATSFYRTLLAMFFTFASSPLTHAQTENVILAFSLGAGGSNPRGGLIFDSAGNLYGTTVFGGSGGCNGSGCGVVFELSPSSSGWTEKILYTFLGGRDGGNPWATLTFDAAGNLYGTATIGGNPTACSGRSCGVVFKLSPQSDGTWKESVLHAFLGGTDGQFPMGTLIFDAAGNLYGTTRWGGSTSMSCFPAVGCGIAFKLSPTTSGPWKERVIRTFLGDANGGEPYEGMTFDSAGNLYGTLVIGGYQGFGTVYRLSPTASGPWKQTVLYQFTRFSTSDGWFPTSRVIFDAAGNIYGTTAEGGSADHGTVFELSPTSTGRWKERLIHQFAGSDLDDPNDIIFDAAGNIWGTTSLDALHFLGGIFELSPASGGNWNENVFFLPNTVDGYGPVAGLTQGSDGNFYGTMPAGGPGVGYGVVFQFVP